MDFSPLDRKQNKQQHARLWEEIDLTNVRELRKLLSAYSMRPNKSFGQHFLTDRSVLQKIIAAAAINSTDQVLEVGAGTGVLTRELARRANRVVAVEMERDMLSLLSEMTSNYTNVELVARNLLSLDPGEVFADAPYKLVANLPYYITAPTFRHFFESANPPRLCVVMVQLEVAQRIVAAPGDLSMLAVSVQFYGRPELIERVPASAFYPAPKVDSAILRVELHHNHRVGANPSGSRPLAALSLPNTTPAIPTMDYAGYEQAGAEGPEQRMPITLQERKDFFRVVQAGFSEKRKQLHNSLARGLQRGDDDIRSWLGAANIEPGRRAETLSIEEWLCLWREVQKSNLSSDVL